MPRAKRMVDSSSMVPALTSRTDFSAENPWSQLPGIFKVVTVLSALFALLAFAACSVSVLALIRGRGPKRATAYIVTLLASIISFTILHVTQFIYLVLYLVADTSGSTTLILRLPRPNLLTVIALFAWWSDALMLLALILLLAHRRTALQSMIGSKVGSDTWAKVAIGMCSAMFILGLVIGGLRGQTHGAVDNESLAQDDYETRLGVLQAIRFILLSLFALIIGYLAKTTSNLRKTVSSIGRRDLPTNVLAFVALPLISIKWTGMITTEIVAEVISESSDDKSVISLASMGILGICPQVIILTLTVIGIQRRSWTALDTPMWTLQVKNELYVNLDVQKRSGAGHLHAEHDL